MDFHGVIVSNVDIFVLLQNVLSTFFKFWEGVIMFPMSGCLYKTCNINVMSEYRVTDYFMIMRVVRDAYTSCIIIK